MAKAGVSGTGALMIGEGWLGIWLGLLDERVDAMGELVELEGFHFALLGPLTAVDECSLTVDWDSSQRRRQLQGPSQSHPRRPD
jgi:hypothetical protein